MKKILNLIKNNIIFITIVITLLLLCNIKLPYYIEAPGGLININNRYEIEQSYDIKGSINMTYVSEYKCTIPTFIMAKLNKNMDIIKKEQVIYENETEKDNEYRGKLMLEEANDNAIILAYKKANKEYKIKNQEMYITYIDNNSKTDLKIGDKIISINNEKVNSIKMINNIIKNKNIGDKINITVTNNNKKYNRYAYILENKAVGIMVTYKRKITTYPKIKINYKKNEYGSSGGLMTSLAIYNKLTSKDITNGYKIAGTGTIDEDGNVGEIGGIKYKLKGAVKEKADIFLVPSGSNYNEAIKLKKENNYDIDIIKIKTFDDALNYLNSL